MYQHNRIRQLSTFVERIRTLDWLKNDDDALKAEIPRSNFILFVEKNPVVQRNGNPRNLFSSYSTRMFHVSDLEKVAPGLRPEDAKSALIDVIPSVQDGKQTLTALLALNLPNASKMALKSVAPNHEIINLRTGMYMIAESEQQGLLCKANSLLKWAATFKYCPKCATPLHQKRSKALSSCPNCHQVFYPWVSPVVICLITDSLNENCLLVRQPRHPPGMFTCVAGYVDVGETLENAVRREIAEEVGLEIAESNFAGRSQSWPFPQNSLMCAFQAVMDQKWDPIIDKSELEGAGWFSKTECRHALENTMKNFEKMADICEEKEKLNFIPPPGTIAYWLLNRWIQQ